MTTTLAITEATDFDLDIRLGEPEQPQAARYPDMTIIPRTCACTEVCGHRP